MSAAADKDAKDRQAVIEKIAAIPAPHAALAARLHETVIAAAPELRPRLWYGMPGYAPAKSKPVVAFFRVDDGIVTFGLTEKANAEREPDSLLRPCAWYLDDVDDATLARIANLVRTAIG